LEGNLIGKSLLMHLLRKVSVVSLLRKGGIKGEFVMDSLLRGNDMQETSDSLKRGKIK
jgi:hypothetical protein